MKALHLSLPLGLASLCLGSISALPARLKDESQGCYCSLAQMAGEEGFEPSTQGFGDLNDAVSPFSQPFKDS